MSNYTKEDIERAFVWGQEFGNEEAHNWEESDTPEAAKRRYNTELQKLYYYLEVEHNE